MTVLSKLKKHVGWWLFALAVCAYALGIYPFLTGKINCDSFGPNMLFMLSVAIGAISCAILMHAAVVRRSLALGIASLAVALLVLLLAFAIFNLTFGPPLLGCGNF